MAGKRILEKKLKRIQEFETDAVGLASSLESLSPLYGADTSLVEIRRTIKQSMPFPWALTSE